MRKHLLLILMASYTAILFTQTDKAVTNINEGFEGTFPPTGWEIKYSLLSDTTASGNPSGSTLINPPTPSTWIKSSFTAHGGTYSAYSEWDNPEFNWLITPDIIISEEYRLNFWLYFYHASGDYSKFHTLLNNGQDGWVSLLNFNESSPDNYWSNEINFDLNNFIGDTIRIAFVSEFNDGWEMAIDDIWIKEFPNPKNIVTSCSDSTITLTWDSVPETSGYTIYSSTNPHGSFTLDSTGTFNGEKWTAPFNGLKLFYYITSIF